MSDQAETLCGPAELIDKLIECRQYGHNAASGHITDGGVRRLVMLSYLASQAVEEGRYPRCRLFVPPLGGESNPQDPWQLAKFGRPVRLQKIDDLRRLAPSAASHDFALEVYEQQTADGESELLCAGVRLAHSGENATEIFSTSLWARLVRPGLMIRIDGPGELRVSEGNTAWDLRAGTLFDLGGIVPQPPPLWLYNFAKKSADNGQLEHLVSHTLYFAWHELLHAVSEQRRGGCLVVLPDSSLTAPQADKRYGIQLKFPVDGPFLGNEVLRFVQLCQQTQDVADVSVLRESSNEWLRQRNKVLSHVDVLAQMAGVDGCTVFDADIRLVGFGGKIHFPSGAATKRFVEARNGGLITPDVMARTGTRHSSAYRLSDEHAGVWCYVVSQDGQVTAFWSDDVTVKRWYPYWPWAKMSDQF
jgi:hypothetical protein